MRNANGLYREAAASLDRLAAELDARKTRQLRAYAFDYVLNVRPTQRQ